METRHLLGLAGHLPLIIALAARLSRTRNRFWDWRFWAAAGFGLAAATGVLEPLGMVCLAGTALLAVKAGNAKGPWKALAALGTVALCLALGAHLLPGVRNPLVFSGRLSPASTDYRLFWNFDKAFAGLMLLPLAGREGALPALGARAWKACLGFLALAVLAAALTGMTRWDPKFSWTLLLWAPANLFLVCIPEEALFRLLLQGRGEAWLAGRGLGPRLAVLAAALLFGLVHFRGGPEYMAAAALAGAAYGCAYRVRRDPWHPVLTHFGLNLVHFLFFAYPFARR